MTFDIGDKVSFVKTLDRVGTVVYTYYSKHHRERAYAIDYHDHCANHGHAGHQLAMVCPAFYGDFLERIEERMG